MAVLFLAAFTQGDADFQERKAPEKPKLVQRIVEIKYVDQSFIHNLLHQYKSARGKVSTIPRDNRVIIEDTPEAVQKLLEMIHQLDVKPLDIQFNMDLIMASLDPEGGVDKDLKGDAVIKEMQSMLKYRSFTLLDRTLIKVQDRRESNQRLGGKGMSFRLRLRPRHIKEEKGDSFNIDLSLYRAIWVEGKENMSSLVSTTLSLKSGERTVVGISKLNGDDKALVLILSGKVLK